MAAVSRTVYQVNPKTNSVITYVMPVKGLNGQDVAKTLPLFNRKTCVMSAAAIKGRDSEGGFNLTVEAPTGDTGGTIGAISRELQKVTILASPSEAATFLDVAMFGICMVAMNGDLKVEDMVELIKHSITQAADIAKTREKTKKEVLAGDADGSMEFGKITPGQPTAPPGDPGVPKERLKGPGSN